MFGRPPKQDLTTTLIEASRPAPAPAAPADLATLAPEDIVNKRFQPTKFREGYDQDEVDDFLDEIVVTMRTLLAKNSRLEEQVSQLKTTQP